MLSISSYSPQTLLVVSLSLAVILISVLAYFIKGSSSTKRSAVLLLGTSGGGKTAILSTLLYGRTLPTQTSIQTNISNIELSDDSRKGPIKVIDIPGHPRLRDDYRKYLETTKAVIFVVDSSTITRNATAVAEHLHQVLHTLTSLPPTRTSPSLCILAHKADLIALPTSTPSSSTREELAATRVRTILERELDRRRLAQVGGVGMDKLASPVKGGDDEDSESVGMSGLECRTPGGTFKFEDWEGGETIILGSYVKVSQLNQSEKVDEKAGGDNEKDGLAQLREWFDEL